MYFLSFLYRPFIVTLMGKNFKTESRIATSSDLEADFRQVNVVLPFDFYRRDGDPLNFPFLI